ncbi:hypothetical protein TTHERM_00144880 (macronuclear) [Tetrahymena thermophila SB210]|uniref:Uncharacterized protein n=1 Tax=Tetrahymena thermophila (strain SB210) TaxID=312017 RepID=I7LU99_TETTS|nr:hypothetical protein TTHERM_00144880 [Tetrahymena thermophila SB210]EAR90883.2 hypothetical protein TTHERM_00144880 [Tetrahymena thermophila SB210]|eukprot:XP_001011128.2 hypothetical protein TTHERM_00144880 [Tetrahymena thermophila SB210]
MTSQKKKTQNDSSQYVEQESHLNDKNNNYYEKLIMDKQSKGYQILREYVYYYGYNFCELCRLVDAQDRQLITKSEFRSILNTNKIDFYLTAEQIEEILTDLQTKFDGTDHYIPYYECYQLMKSYPPKTKFAVALMLGTKRKNPEDHQYDSWEKEIDKQRRNFWDRREPGEDWDFKYDDLTRLEISIMQSKRDEHGNIVQEEENDEEEYQNNKSQYRQATENEQYEKSVKNLYMMNNETILKNFDIKIAQQIAKILKPSNIVQFTDEQIEKVFRHNFGQDSKRIGQIYKIKHYFEDDFSKVIQEHFKELKLTEDEISLLHYRIWEDNNFAQFTFETLSRWVIKNRNQKLRELRTLGLSEQDQRRILNKQEAQSPKLFKQLVKYAYSFGLNFLMTSLSPIIERDNYILLNNITLYFKSLGIQFVPQDINDLKFYLANHGCIHLQDKSEQGFLNTSLLLDTKKLVDLITREAQKIAMNSIDFKAVGNKSKEQARRSIQSKIVQGIVNKLSLKLKIYTDENDLIEEIKLRKVVADYFSEIDQSDLDIVFSKLQNITQPSKYQSQRKIYLPELIDYLLGGPLFDDVLFQKINDFEKNQKIRDLGISNQQNIQSNNKEGEKSKLFKHLVLDNENFQDTQMNTQETNKSMHTGQVSFKINQDQQNQNTQDSQQHLAQSEPIEVPKKFLVVTKESIQKQIIEQKKQQKVKKVSEQSKQGNNAVDNQVISQNDKNQPDLQNQIEYEDIPWIPDYRKIALDQLGVKEKPKPGIDYIKGGFIYEENDDAFVAKPLDDRQVVNKLYESLKRKILVGQRATLKDFDAVDYVLIQFRNKLQAMDEHSKGAITLQQFYSFIKLNFPEFSPQECYQLRSMAEAYSTQNQYQNDSERLVSYTYFCMNLHKFICQNILFNDSYQQPNKW